MSLSKSKCWYLNNCLQFLKRAVPLFHISFQARLGATQPAIDRNVRQGVMLRGVDDFFTKV